MAQCLRPLWCIALCCGGIAQAVGGTAIDAILYRPHHLRPPDRPTVVVHAPQQVAVPTVLLVLPWAVDTLLQVDIAPQTAVLIPRVVVLVAVIAVATSAVVTIAVVSAVVTVAETSVAVAVAETLAVVTAVAVSAVATVAAASAVVDKTDKTKGALQFRNAPFPFIQTSIRPHSIQSAKYLPVWRG